MEISCAFPTTLDSAEHVVLAERTAPEERHLAVHEQHCVGLNDADAAAWEAGGFGIVEEVTARSRTDDTRDILTPQEAQIARLAATAFRTPRSAPSCSSAPARCSTTCARSS